MPRGRNKDFIIEGIKMILKRNYKVDLSLIDVKSEVDSTLTYHENYRIVYEKAKRRGLINKFKYY